MHEGNCQLLYYTFLGFLLQSGTDFNVPPFFKRLIDVHAIFTINHFIYTKTKNVKKRESRID